MKKEKKVITHKILDGNYVVGMILLTVLAYLLVTTILGGGLSGIVGVVAAIAGTTAPMALMYLAIAISAFIMLAIHKRWFYPEFEGNLKSNNLGKWMLVTAVLLLISIIPDFIILLATKGTLVPPTIISVMTSLVAGTTEEVIFRAVPVSYGMRQIRDSKKIPVVLIISSVLFGLIHAGNIFAGAAVQATLLQVLSAFGTGLLLGALYLRSGSILPAMMFHFLYDIYAMCNADAVSETGVMAEALSSRDVIANLLSFVIHVSLAIYLFRKPLWEEVMRIWNKKWNKQESGSAAETYAEIG